jgi:outer membrane protein OmpA-like peptidoglycan-associated protein
MHLDREDAKRWRLFERYLVERFIHVLTKPRVMRAYYRWNPMRADVARKLIAFRSTPPRLKVDNLRQNPETCGKEWAMTVSEDTVLIDRQLVERVEAAMWRAVNGTTGTDVQAIKDEHAFEFAEAVIMHELVHVGHKDRGIDEKMRYGSDEHATEAFEREAYGALMRFWERECRLPEPALPATVVILFNHDSAELGAEMIPRLQKAKALIDQREGVGVTIQGHADSTGTSDYNTTLSLRRAEAVKRWLMDHRGGLDLHTALIPVVGQGEDRPFMPDREPRGSEKNRRVEILFEEASTPGTTVPGRPGEVRL